MNINLNGHKVDIEYLKNQLQLELTFERLAHSIKDAKLKKDFGQFKQFNIFNCHECGEKLKLETNGPDWICSNPCPYPKGIGPFVFELNVPSGKLVVANNLCKYFPVQDFFHINNRAEEKNRTLAFAKAGLAHCFVGNTCPGVYGEKSSRFIIGSHTRKNPRFKNGGPTRRLAGICTDLWWFSICDYDEFCKSSRHESVQTCNEFLKNSCEIVKCLPGVYRFKHMYHMRDHDDYKDDKNFIYTYFEKIREPDRLIDYETEYNSLNLTAGQVLASSRHKSVIEAANTALCVGGSGFKYHPNGFWSDRILSNDSPSVEIPVFDEKYSWYPFTEHSAIAEIAGVHDKNWPLNNNIGKINDSFIALAFNICRCIAVHGAKPFGSHKGVEIQAKQTEKIAKKCLLGLATKYPDKIPENCVKILKKLNKT